MPNIKIMKFNTKYIAGLVMLFIFLLDTVSADAQIRRTRTRDDDRQRDRSEEQIPVNEKLAYSIQLGNLGFSNNGFSFSMKGEVGYKLIDRIAAGITPKFFVDIIGQPVGTDDVNLFSYGVGAFARLSVTNDIFIQGEYNLTSFDDDIRLGGERDLYAYPSIGAGYESGYGPWRGGILFLYTMSKEVRTLPAAGFGEYWITFSYNF